MRLISYFVDCDDWISVSWMIVLSLQWVLDSNLWYSINFQVTRLAGTAWFLAIILNVANVFLYETKEIEGKVYCRNILYDHPQVYLQTYITIIAILVVILPFFIICFTYARIFQKIADKTSESRKSKRSSIKPGKVSKGEKIELGFGCIWH